MKKILLSLFGFITLGLVNFGYCAFSVSDIPSSAIITTGTVDHYYNLTASNSMYVYTLSSQDATALPSSYYCAYVYNFDQSSLLGSAWLTFGFGNSFAFTWASATKSYSSSFGNSSYFVEPLRLWLNTDGIYENGALMCAYNYRKYFNIGISETSVSNNTYKFDYIVFDYNKLAFASSVDCSQDSNYLQCIQDKNTCEGMYERLSTDYDLLSGNYNTCTSELFSCLHNGGTSGDVQWSSLYINQVQHLGNKNIYIDIPLDYEYSYTNEGDDFELTVEGLNQDYGYLDGVVGVQSTIPSKDNLNQIVSGLIPLFVPGLVVILFIYFVFKLLKKIF